MANIFKINIDLNNANQKIITDKQNFIEECKEIMNLYKIFDKYSYKDKLKRLYICQKYYYEINDNFYHT